MNAYIKKSVNLLSAYTPGEQPAPSQNKLIKLNTNENPYPPSPKVAAALATYEAESLKLYSDPESRDLCRAIAEVHGCALERVFAGNGSDEVLALCTRAFVEDDGVIGFFEPSYSLYPVLAKIRCVKTCPQDLGKEFEWQMPDDYSASIFFLSCPNSPTGIRYPKEQIRAFCSRFKGLVVIDEAYAAFAEENCLELALEMDNVLLVRTLSKSHSLAGLRLGYAIGPVALIQALFKIKDSYNLGRIPQVLARAAILDQEWVSDNIEKVKNTRHRCAESLAGIGFDVVPSEANFLWVKPQVLSAEFLYHQLRERNILIRYFPGSRTGDYLRISIGTDDDMDVLLAAINELCRKA